MDIQILALTLVWIVAISLVIGYNLELRIVHSVLRSLNSNIAPRTERLEHRSIQYERDIRGILEGLRLILEGRQLELELYVEMAQRLAGSEPVDTGVQQEERLEEERDHGPTRALPGLSRRPRYQFPDSDLDKSDRESGVFITSARPHPAEGPLDLVSGYVGERRNARRNELRLRADRMLQVEDHWSDSDEEEIYFSNSPSLPSNQTEHSDEHHEHYDHQATSQAYEYDPQNYHPNHARVEDGPSDCCRAEEYPWGDFWDGTGLARRSTPAPDNGNRRVEAGPSTGRPEAETTLHSTSAPGTHAQQREAHSNLRRDRSAQPDVFPYYHSGTERLASENGYDGDHDDNEERARENNDDPLPGQGNHARAIDLGDLAIIYYANMKLFRALRAAERGEDSYPRRDLSSDCGEQAGYPSITLDQKVALYSDWVRRQSHSGQDSSIQAWEREVLRRGLLAMFEELVSRHLFMQREEEFDEVEAGPSRPRGGSSGRPEPADVEQDPVNPQPEDEPERGSSEDSFRPPAFLNDGDPEFERWLNRASTPDLILELSHHRTTQRQRTAIREVLRFHTSHREGVPEQRREREERAHLPDIENPVMPSASGGDASRLPRSAIEESTRERRSRGRRRPWGIARSFLRCTF
ncbi:hypothetical protein K491DRAFT_100329 [Lophiostoma macrostomum CBS 122681]|uniref:Uncharacterized protein n=1 Tax=Lophiostoma macrostomum CBS 122681 TaxID=1314788 RepID=A0A6A6SXR8_9PLEO|nr:hypothetical protein K491DRAFT_100329 [Lophiostoma macrostomum CBS 122681]